MADTVIFIDGEYARKIFINKSYRIDVPKFIEIILKESKIDSESLLRAYLYTAPPFQSSTPTLEEKERYKGFQKFLNYLQKQDSLEVRLGRTEKRDGNFKQKMVDVLLSIDLVELSAKSKINTAILIAGDSDFVPAIQKAKNNGARVILFCSENKNEYHLNLWNEADRRIFITEKMMQECCSK
jgi:uncharacterized LabA/DUF88 family protein